MNALYKLSVIVETIDKLSGPVRKMMGAVQGLERAAQKGKALVEFGQRTSLTGALVQGAADKMKGMMFDLIAPTMEIQDAMASLKTVTTSTLGSVERSMELTRQRALEWSKAHTDSAADYIRTAYMMASAGLNDVQAIAATETAMRVAKATMADSAETANLVAIMYNNMGDKTRDVQKEMARLGDVLTRTQQYFQFENLGQLTEGLKYAIPAALQYKTSVEELNVVIGQLNNAGLQGSMAGTAFAATMRQIIPASRELGFEIARDAQGGVSLIGTIENIRKKFGDFGSMSDDMRIKFQKAFGDEGLRAIALLTGQINEMKKGLAEVQNAAGVAAKAQAEVENTVSQQYQILQNNITAVKAQISGQLIPVINQVIPPIRQGFQWLGRFTNAHPGLTRTIVLIAAIGTGALAIVAPLLMVVGGFMSVMGTGVQAAATVGRAIVKLGPLARGAGRHIQEAFTWSREAIRSVGPGLARLGGQLISFGRTAILQAASGIRALGLGIVNFGRQAIRTAITSLPPLIAQVWAFTAALLANPITWVIIAVVALGGALYLLIRHWDAVKAAVSDAWAKIVGATRTAIAWVRENLIGLGRTLLSMVFPPLAIAFNWDQVKVGLNAMGDFIRTGLEWVRGFVARRIELAALGWDAIKNSLNAALIWVKGLWSEFKKSGAALWDAFVEGLKSLIAKPVEVVKEGLARIRKLLPFSDAKEGPLSELTRSGMALIRTFAQGAEQEIPNLKKTLATGLATVALAIPAPVVASTGAPGVTLPPQARVASYEVAPLPSPELPDLSARVGFEVAPLRLPELPEPSMPEAVGVARYRAALEGPAIPEVTGVARYIPTLERPKLSPVEGVASYEVAPLPAPKLPDLLARVGFEVAPFEVPRVPDLGAEVRYKVTLPEIPKPPAPVEREVAGSKGERPIGRISGPQSIDLSGLVAALRGQTQKKEKGGLIIQGDVHIHVERMDNPDDLFAQLKRLGEEAGT